MHPRVRGGTPVPKTQHTAQYCTSTSSMASCGSDQSAPCGRTEQAVAAYAGRQSTFYPDRRRQCLILRKSRSCRGGMPAYAAHDSAVPATAFTLEGARARDKAAIAHPGRGASLSPPTPFGQRQMCWRANAPYSCESVIAPCWLWVTRSRLRVPHLLRRPSSVATVSLRSPRHGYRAPLAK